MKIIQKSVGILLALGMTAGLAGCGATDTGFVPSLDTDTACEIRMVGSYENFEAMEEEFDRFNEYYPNVELSYTYVDDYRNTIQAVLASEEAPNIYFEYEDVQATPQTLSDASVGLDLSSIREGLIYHNEDGDVTMIPMFANAYGMLVNEDLFEAQGLEVPTTDSVRIMV